MARRHSVTHLFERVIFFISRVVIENIANVLEHRRTRLSIHKKSFNLRQKKGRKKGKNTLKIKSVDRFTHTERIRCQRCER